MSKRSPPLPRDYHQLEGGDLYHSFERNQESLYNAYGFVPPRHDEDEDSNGGEEGTFGNATSQGGGIWEDVLTFADKHFNGGLNTAFIAVQGYNKLPNDIKRAYAFKLSQMIGVKSGQIFQGAKGFANGTGKLVSKLGPIGNALSIGLISYEVGTNTWDAHTIANGALLIGTGVATVFAAPAVLTGIAIYGVGDYFFGFSDIIDNNIGRNSGIW